MMRPVTDNPGVYRCDDGRLIHMGDFPEPFETSDRFPTISLAVRWDNLRILQGWRLSFARQPHPAELQQLAELLVGGERIATASVGTLLLEQPLSDRLIPPAVNVEVRLLEQPVEGAGLRLHLRGLSGQKPTVYGETR